MSQKAPTILLEIKNIYIHFKILHRPPDTLLSFICGDKNGIKNGTSFRSTWGCSCHM